MSKLDNDGMVDMPPNRHTLKRQKTNDEMKLKISYPKTLSFQRRSGTSYYFFQMISSSNDATIKVLNKGGEYLKEYTMVDLTNEAFHKSLFNLKYQYLSSDSKGSSWK